MKRITDGQNIIWEKSMYYGESLEDVHDADSGYLPYLLDKFGEDLPDEDREAIEEVLDSGVVK